jgi:V-type H+-transporting ATPase subunit a
MKLIAISSTPPFNLFREIEAECRKFGLKCKRPRETKDFFKAIEEEQKRRGRERSTLLDEIETEVGKNAKFLKDQAQKYKEMYDKFLWLVKYKHILDKMKEVHAKNMMNTSAIEELKTINEPLLRSRPHDRRMRIDTIVGAINTEDCVRFERLIFRITRGNSIVKFSKFEANQGIGIPGEEEQSIFIILYQEGDVLKNRIVRVCDMFSKERFEIADDSFNKGVEITKNMVEAKNLLLVTNEERIKSLKRMLRVVEGTDISLLAFQEWYVIKEKSLYTALSKLEVRNALLSGLCWCPTKHVEKIISLITNEGKTKGTTATVKVITNHSVTPPTLLEINEFNWVFQEVVSTYGVPSYGEVNPAFFTVITFPFLFGVMFGDVCHGLILFIAGLILCVFKDTLIKSKALISELISIRYMLLFMGIFAIFSGFLYNEFAGFNMNIFSSCYKIYHEVDDSLDVKREDNCVYQFGMDSLWKTSERELQFSNSFKMKFSIIIGVIHMFIGVCLKLVNSIHFGKWVDGWFEFLPQAIFLLAMFGYMNVFIIAKWLTAYENPCDAPVLITAIINMYIGFGRTDNITFDVQPKVNFIMFMLIVICIPIMLIPKPCILKAQHAKKRLQIMQKNELFINRDTILNEDGKTDSAFSEEESIFSNSNIVLHPKTEKFIFSETFVHQLIETIEYALGTISNTASYLRLWALSLAHAQLSTVFLEYAIMSNFEGKPSYFKTIVVFKL